MFKPTCASMGLNKPLLFVIPVPSQTPIPGTPSKYIGDSFSQIDSGAIIEDSVSSTTFISIVFEAPHTVSYTHLRAHET